MRHCVRDALFRREVMNQTVEWVEQDLAVQYATALQDYLAGDGESALQHAYQLGRKALARKVGLAALVAMHHQALARLLLQIIKPQMMGISLEMQAETFFREVQVPFETLLRGYDEAVAKLNRLGESLDRISGRLMEADREKERVMAESKLLEEALHRTYGELENRFQLQSAELAAAGETLRAEIAERKLAEIALRESEARFHVIFQRAGIGIGLLDTDGCVTESNLALQQMLGYSSEELQGRSLLDFSHPDDLGISAQSFKDLVEGKYTHYRLERRLIRKDGAVLWVRQSVAGVYGFQGELQFAIDMIEDITDSKRSEEALQESEARFRQIADMTCEWIWDQDEEGRYTYSSSAVKAILGYQPEEILGKPYYELLPPEDRARAAALAPEMMVRKETFLRLVTRYRHKGGHEVFTESTGTPILDSEGRVLKWRGMDHDITERKRFEDALRLRDRAIEASSVGIIITDPHQPNNPIIHANPAFIRMTGRSRDEVIGQNPRFLQGPGTDPEALAEIHQALREGRDCHLTLKNYRKDGTPFWNELFISPVRDEQGHLTHYIGTQTDVTALRQMEEERHEMEIARQIQLSLLPRIPLQLNGALVAGYCRPAVHVGGDYFDYFKTGDTVDIVIADVSGHSVGAAMIMAETRSTLKMETHWMLREKAGSAIGAAKTLAILNDLLYEDLNQADSFISMFYIKYDTVTRKLSYADAGHNCPLLWRQSEKACVGLDAEGLILGIKKQVDFEEKTLFLEPGDRVLLYTDGITEAENKAGEFFGIPRLRELFAAQAQASPQAIIKAIVNELEGFCQSQSFDDDISLVVLKVT
jgi:sigma-B regulation protein RsbU (phosphoserine phosphatase)